MALTDIELAEKAKAGTLTLGEAIDYGDANADKTGQITYKKNMTTLRNNVPKLGLSLDMPYKDLKNHVQKFTIEGSPKGVKPANRITPLQNLESILRGTDNAPFNRYGVVGVMEKVGSDVEEVMYPKLAGVGSAGGTQRTGLAGERPMRGLLSRADFVGIYKEALPEVAANYNQATADILQYHATTATRPEQLLGLKKADVVIGPDSITVKGKEKTKKDKKGRPELSYSKDSQIGRMLVNNYESSTSKFLFDVTEGEFTDAFKNHITPRLKPFEDVLPLAESRERGPDGKIVTTTTPVTTPSAVRHIIPRFLEQEFNFSKDIVEGIMGHTGASILSKNYTGMVPKRDLSLFLQNPEEFSTTSFGEQARPRIDLSLLSDEDKANIAQEQRDTVIVEQRAARSQAEAVEAEAYAKKTATLAAITPEDIQKAEESAKSLEEARLRGKKAAKTALEPEKADLIPESNPEARARLEQKGFDAGGMADAISKYLGKGAKVVAGAVGLETARQIITEPAAFARDVAIEGAALAAKAPLSFAGALPMILESSPAGTESDVVPDSEFTQNRPEPLADEEQEAMRDTGFVNIDRGPEAASINQDQGFLSR